MGQIQNVPGPSQADFNALNDQIANKIGYFNQSITITNNFPTGERGTFEITSLPSNSLPLSLENIDSSLANCSVILYYSSGKHNIRLTVLAGSVSSGTYNIRVYYYKV